MKIKTGDTVKVITGHYKGSIGEVIKAYPKKDKVVVEGVNIIKKAIRPNQANPEGGIIEKEGFIDASNVMLVVKGKTTRVGFREENGKKVRFAKATGDKID